MIFHGSMENTSIHIVTILYPYIMVTWGVASSRHFADGVLGLTRCVCIISCEIAFLAVIAERLLIPHAEVLKTPDRLDLEEGWRFRELRVLSGQGYVSRVPCVFRNRLMCLNIILTGVAGCVLHPF